MKPAEPVTRVRAIFNWSPPLSESESVSRRAPIGASEGTPSHWAGLLGVDVVHATGGHRDRTPKAQCQRPQSAIRSDSPNEWTMRWEPVTDHR
jgi:hypothetical protein